MKKFLFLACLLASSWAGAQKNIYLSTHFDDLSKDHKVLAIIPFFTHLDLDDPHSAAELKRLEEKEGYAGELEKIVIEKHLAAFASQFAEKLAHCAESDFYKTIARVIPVLFNDNREVF